MPRLVGASATAATASEAVAAAVGNRRERVGLGCRCQAEAVGPGHKQFPGMSQLRAPSCLQLVSGRLLKCQAWENISGALYP